VKKALQSLLFAFACALAQGVCAQSTDQSLPTPVRSSDVSGKIAALDVGDPRATKHFYAFSASPGDLLITVESKNLDGDVDVFTAITYRPLMKTSIYATSQSPAVTKGIYLRAHQLLILRIEARTPNDDQGTYRIHFGGTFEPFSGGIPVAENTEATETSPEKLSANRLSSVGATIPKPPAEMTETAEAKPSPSPEKTSEKPTEITETNKSETEKPATTARTKTTPPPRRGSRPSTSRRQPPPKKNETPAKSQTEIATVESTKTETSKPDPDKPDAPKTEKGLIDEKPSSTADKSRQTATSEKTKPQEISAQPAGARLIIEEKDGTRIERPMSTVRRVVIEGPTIVVLLKNGKTERIAMADVARMAIEPQQ
jgi:hypothetical protein